MATVTCPGCQARDAQVAALVRRVAELEAAVRDLSARLGTNATDPGTPPSASPLGAPKPVARQKSGRRPGARPGHPPRLKQLPPPERVLHAIPLAPRHCRKCRAP